MMKKYKVVLAHPGKQHSYQTAIAVEHMGCDLLYCTTVYDKPGSITHFIKNFLKGADKAKANTRSCNQIPNNKVHQRLEFYGLYQLLAMRLLKSKATMDRINDTLNDSFGKSIAKLAKRNNADLVISYDNNSLMLFKNLMLTCPQVIRVLDVSAANRIFMREIYKRDCQIQPDFAGKLKNECPIIDSNEKIKRIQDEICCSQYFLVGSSFVRRSLEFSGVRPEQIFVCPYGVDTNKFKRKELRVRLPNEPIRFVFVGGTKELKGLAYMLEAFQMVDHEKATFTIVGVDDLDDWLKKKYAKDVVFTGTVLHNDMPTLLQNYDVMVFPSLGEGFALSIVEAMACGLPVIASCNTGVNDYIRDLYNGFIIPIQDSKSIAEKMQWFMIHHEKIPEMGQNAIETVSQLTWKNYYKSVEYAIEKIAMIERKNREVS